MGFGLARGKPLDVTGHGLELASLPSPDAGQIDPRTWFESPECPLEIEIGPGKGGYLVQRTAHRPDVNLLGIERAGEFYRYAADRMRRRTCRAVRVLHGDALEFLHWWCQDAVATIVHVYFPDPWPKARHHKRRFVQDRTLVDLHRVLRPGGEVRLVTDHDAYWAWCMEHVQRHEHLFEPGPLEVQEATGEFVGTNYERKYRVENRSLHAVVLARRDG